MKKSVKQRLSLALALVLLVGLISGMTQPVSAGSDSSSWVRNWGSRGVTATSMSAAATDFYDDNQVTLEQLAALTGSSDQNAVPSSELYGALQELMADNHTFINSYEDAKGCLPYTDCQNGDGIAYDFYSNAAMGTLWDGSSWTREHTWPKSKSVDDAREDDIMMLRPAASSSNSGRGNTAYGESSGYYDPNGVSGGSLDLRGDVSRIILYVYVRWGQTANVWGTSGVIESKDVLLRWMAADPVDTWELGRNDAVQSITGTRNVFVDYPELGFLLFGESVPAGMTSPSGGLTSQYTITVSVNDAAMGSATLSGTSVTAVPNEGYRVAGYEIVSGSASVSRNGNTFTVAPASDCEIKVLFEAVPNVTLLFMDNGVAIGSATEVKAGTSVTLPAYTGTAPEGYTFLGWSEAQVSHSETKPTVLAAGADYQVNNNTTLYALFSYEAASENGSSTWNLVTDASALANGKNVVIVAVKANVAMSTTQNNNNRGQTAITKNADKTVTITDSVEIFTLEAGTKTGSWSFMTGGKYLYAASSSKNYLRTGYKDDNASWSISIGANGVATIKAQGTNTRNWMRHNSGSSIFSVYSSGQNDISLYMEASAGTTTIYTTASCAHAHTEEQAAVKVGCTTDGYTAGVFCSDCNTYISGHELIPATDHNYEAVVTPPTTTEDGYTTYTCSNCGDTYTGNKVPALGETYTVTFSVPEGVNAPEAMPCNKSGITLPAVEAPDAGWTFLGWVTEAVDNSETVPANILNAGDKYVADADITLKALYSQGEATTAYTLVENASQLTVGGKVVVVAAKANFALSTTQNSNNRAQTAVTKNADKTVTITDNVQVLTLGNGTKAGTWSLHTGSGYLYAASSSKNYLRTQSTLNDNASWSISIGANGVATVKAQGTNTRNWMRYNSSNNPPLFSVYGSGQTDIVLYAEIVSGSVVYTTEFGHVHAGVLQAADPATCTAPGTVAYYLCACGAKFSDVACTVEITDIVDPQKDHSFNKEASEETYLCSPATCKDAATYYISCSGCGIASDKTFSHGAVDPENHVGGTYLSGKADATCEQDGYTGDTCCSGCDKVLTPGEAIPAAHTLTAVAQVDATCEETGIKAHYGCSVCQKLFADAAGKEAVTAEELVIPMLDHTYGDWQTTEDNHWKECNCGHKSEEGTHNYGAWVVVKPEAVGVEGQQQRACTDCGYIQTKIIPAVSSPATGDSFPAGTMFLLLILSGIGLAVPVFLLSTKKNGSFNR